MAAMPAPMRGAALWLSSTLRTHHTAPTNAPEIKLEDPRATRAMPIGFVDLGSVSCTGSSAASARDDDDAIAKKVARKMARMGEE